MCTVCRRLPSHYSPDRMICSHNTATLVIAGTPSFYDVQITQFIRVSYIASRYYWFNGSPVRIIIICSATQKQPALSEWSTEETIIEGSVDDDKNWLAENGWDTFQILKGLTHIERVFNE